jgi:prepilin-type N-terminal cleavage/methylation domain-containing protein
MQIKKAFTLTELSVVALVIAVLITGVTKGSGIINAAYLTNARSLTTKSPIAEISGLVAWYETSLATSLKANEAIDGQQVSEWRDNSPGSIAAQKNKLTRTATSDVTFELNGINNVPTIIFNAAASANFSLSSFYQGISAQNTVFLVFKPVASVSGFTLLDSSSSAGYSTSITISSNTVSLNAGTSASTGTSTNAASFSVGSGYIMAAYFNGSTSQVFLNNATSITGGATISPGTNQLSGLTVGTNKSGSSGFNGWISEIIIYNRPLKLQERKDVMNYLSKKYKISVTGI